jgi:beta-glucanase (GH16 family)
MKSTHTFAWIALALAAIGVAGCSPAPANEAVGSTSPHANTVSTPTSKINWGKPIFTDSFRGTSLNLKRWIVYSDPTASGIRTPRRTVSSVKVENGVLDLIGHYQKPYGYVSGGIAYRFNQTYGRWVVRFRADAGAGYRPVVLLWPRGPWPTDGEIDMAEIFRADRRGGGEFLHLGAKEHYIGHNFPSNVSFTRWHTIAVDWIPGRITFWLDGRELWTVHRGTGNNNYIPSTPFHLTLQNDEGCDTGCKPNKKTPKRVIMQVAWVKIYAAPRSSLRPSAITRTATASAEPQH